GGVEEIDFIPSGTGAGANFGWNGYEGLDVYNGGVAAGIDDHYEPALVIYQGDHPSADDEIIRNAACVIGGYVYRGAAITDLSGWYFFGDCSSNDVAAFRMCDGELEDLQRVPGLTSEGSGLTSFGEDADGELYMVFAGTGALRRVVGAAAPQE